MPVTAKVTAEARPWELYPDLNHSPNKLSTQLIGWASSHWCNYSVQRDAFRPQEGSGFQMGSIDRTGRLSQFWALPGCSYDGMPPFSVQQPSAPERHFDACRTWLLIILAERACITGFL